MYFKVAHLVALLNSSEYFSQSAQHTLSMNKATWVILGFCCGVNEICALLGFYTVENGSFL
jgi:hypothetical protein